MNPEKDLYAFFFFAGKNLGLRNGKNTLSKFEIFATFQGLDKIWLSTGTCDHFEAISTRRQLSPSPPPPLLFLSCVFPSVRRILGQRYLEGWPEAWEYSEQVPRWFCDEGPLPHGWEPELESESSWEEYSGPAGRKRETRGGAPPLPPPHLLGLSFLWRVFDRKLFKLSLVLFLEGSFGPGGVPIVPRWNFPYMNVGANVFV